MTSSTIHTNGYITARVDELRELVRQYRANEIALRRLGKSTPSRNVGATESAVLRREQDRYIAERSVAFASDRAKYVVGALIAERDLIQRLDVAKATGQERSELRARLAVQRKSIRDLLIGGNA